MSDLILTVQKKKQTFVQTLINLFFQAILLAALVVFGLESFSYEVPNAIQNLASAYLIMYGLLLIFVATFLFIGVIAIAVTVAQQTETINVARHKRLTEMAAQYSGKSVSSWLWRSVTIVFVLAVIGSGRIWIGSFFLLGNLAIWVFASIIKQMVLDYISDLTPAQIAELNNGLRSIENEP